MRASGFVAAALWTLQLSALAFVPRQLPAGTGRRLTSDSTPPVLRPAQRRGDTEVRERRLESGRTGGLGLVSRLILWTTAALPTLLWCPSPELLAGVGLDRVVTSSSRAAALTDEQQLVADVWKRVDKLYYDRTFNGQDWFSLRQTALKKNIKSTQDVYDAIKAMLEPLGDPYTRFLPPSQYQSLYGLATGEVAGIGVSLLVDPDTKELTIAEVEKESPASAAGLQSGDQIITIDGQASKGVLIDDSASLLRGPPGSKVGVVTRRPSTGETKDLILTRQTIKIQAVEASTAKKDAKTIGVIRIRSFSQTTADSVAKELEKLEKQGIDAILLDLRGNPGGYLGGGIDTARLFLPSTDRIVTVLGKTGISEDYQTTEDGEEVSKPIFVLVDKRTASAAEVLSAALQENGRAKLVGETTFGKGVIQTIEPVSQGAGISVTIARYATPLGHNINKKGIEPDISKQCEPTAPAVTCLPDRIS